MLTPHFQQMHRVVWQIIDHARAIKLREEASRRVKAAKRAAGINVRSSPGQANRAKSMDDELWSIANRVYGR
jgi:hypothetical protein